MKLWIAVGFYAGEGFDVPIGIFDSREAATKAIEALERNNYEETFVIPFELNKAGRLDD